MKTTGRRGATLATVLAIIVMAAVAAFLLTGVSMASLMFSSADAASMAARKSAESCIELAFARVLEDQAYAGEVSIRTATGHAHVAFDADRARALGVPLSPNNLLGSEPKSVPGRSVPPGHLYLVALGRSGSHTTLMECMLYDPPFRTPLGTSGRFASTGGLEVGMLMVNGSIGPGDLASGSSGPNSVVLGPSIRVRGAVKTLGGVDKDPVAVIDGGIIATREPLPRVPMLDPTAGQNPTLLQASLTGPVQGFAQRDGDLSVPADLVLRNGILTVNGDLRVTGGIHGQGAIFVSGRVEVVGTSSLQAEDRIALVAQGDVVLQGNGPGSSRYQGLIYSGGAFRASKLNLTGVFVSQPRSGPNALMQLDEVRLVQNQEYGSMVFNAGGGSTPGGVTPPSRPVLLQFCGTCGGYVGKPHDGSTSHDGLAPPIAVNVSFTSNSMFETSTMTAIPDVDLQSLQPLGMGAQNFFQQCQATNFNPTDFNASMPFLQTTINSIVQRNPDGDNNGGGGSRTGGSFTFDLSKFIAPEERMKVTLWRTTTL